MNVLKTQALFGKAPRCSPSDTLRLHCGRIYQPMTVDFCRRGYTHQRLMDRGKLEGTLGWLAMNPDLPDRVQNGPREGGGSLVSPGYSCSSELDSGHTELELTAGGRWHSPSRTLTWKLSPAHPSRDSTPGSLTWNHQQKPLTFPVTSLCTT